MSVVEWPNQHIVIWLSDHLPGVGLCSGGTTVRRESATMRRNHRTALRFEVAAHHELPVAAALNVAKDIVKNLLRLFFTLEHWRRPLSCQGGRSFRPAVWRLGMPRVSLTKSGCWIDGSLLLVPFSRHANFYSDPVNNFDVR